MIAYCGQTRAGADRRARGAGHRRVTLADRIVEALVFGRPGRVLAVLVPLGLLGWVAVDALGGPALVVAIAVPGLAALIAIAAWIMGDLPKLWRWWR